MCVYLAKNNILFLPIVSLSISSNNVAGILDTDCVPLNVYASAVIASMVLAASDGEPTRPARSNLRE